MKWKRYYSFWQSVILSAQTTPPHPIPTPTRILYSPDTHFSLTLSIFLRLSLHLSQPIASGMHFHKAVLHQDKSFQILYCWEPFHLFPDSCWTTKAFLSYLKNKTLTVAYHHRRLVHSQLVSTNVKICLMCLHALLAEPQKLFMYN